MPNVLGAPLDQMYEQGPAGPFFEPPDLSGLADTQLTIRSITECLPDHARRGSVLLQSYVELLHDEVGLLQEQLKTAVAQGGWLAVSGADVDRAMTINQKTLSEDYSDDEDGGLLVPAASITAVSALPRPLVTVQGRYSPVLDLRIRTSANRPVPVYAAPGVVEYQPSLGSWFRFELGATALRHVTKPS